MSLFDVYQKTKNEKKPTNDKVMLASHTQEIKTNLGSLYETITKTQNDVDEMKKAIANLEKADMNGFAEKHKNMKNAFNDLVTSYTEMQADINSVIVDLSKRVGEIETKFQCDL